MKKELFLEASDLNKYYLQLILETYPDGYEYDDILTIKGANEKYLKVIKLEDIDTIIYVKVSVKLEEILEAYFKHNNSKRNDDFDFYFDDYL